MEIINHCNNEVNLWNPVRVDGVKSMIYYAQEMGIEHKGSMNTTLYFRKVKCSSKDNCCHMLQNEESSLMGMIIFGIKA